ncbi:TetR/AcrR family transcriptional regulator [Nocardia sp. 2]|uniref:TetR/AcrR family transcriptional regulator n=1 Tax=Nocardia acididurans TaxID=2802282 RepID=A0ABS1M9E3_9NOCA|nr:TetR/AcrR family transcriptional regulator [Nocardia acididurans]MBL1077189.1 TetR/AcrR family transcriptional regulator [Nocardia acididurans]
MRKVDPELHAAKREAILDAAADLFGRNGYDATRTADICRAAGMSTGNMFHYFPTKRAVLLAVAERDGQRTAAALAGIAEATDIRAALLDTLEAVCHIAADRTAAGLQLEISAEAQRDPELAELFRTGDRGLRAAFETALAAGIGSGAFDSALDPARTATWLAALVDGVFARVAADPEFDPVRETPTLHHLAAALLPRPGTVGI